MIDLKKPLLTGAFVDPAKVTQFTEKDFILPEIAPFSWLIKNSKVRNSKYFADQLNTNKEILIFFSPKGC